MKQAGECREKKTKGVSREGPREASARKTQTHTTACRHPILPVSCFSNLKLSSLHTPPPNLVSAQRTTISHPFPRVLHVSYVAHAGRLGRSAVCVYLDILCASGGLSASRLRPARTARSSLHKALPV
jgi:hypothetical protein